MHHVSQQTWIYVLFAFLKIIKANWPVSFHNFLLHKMHRHCKLLFDLLINLDIAIIAVLDSSNSTSWSLPHAGLGVKTIHLFSQHCYLWQYSGSKHSKHNMILLQLALKIQFSWLTEDQYDQITLLISSWTPERLNSDKMRMEKFKKGI